MYVLYLKRLFDLALAFILLIGFSWLLLLICFVYLLPLDRPVFFTQTRIGKNEKIFNLIKFRTLKDVSTLAVQERRFWFGDLLRLTSLDELPQLWNVIKGEMSLIGPRPLPVEYLPLFSTPQRQRHQVRPGITGWAQVNGRHSITWNKKFEMDIFM